MLSDAQLRNDLAAVEAATHLIFICSLFFICSLVQVFLFFCQIHPNVFPAALCVCAKDNLTAHSEAQVMILTQLAG